MDVIANVPFFPFTACSTHVSGALNKCPCRSSYEWPLCLIQHAYCHVWIVAYELWIAIITFKRICSIRTTNATLTTNTRHIPAIHFSSNACPVCHVYRLRYFLCSILFLRFICAENACVSSDTICWRATCILWYVRFQTVHAFVESMQ